MRASCFATTRCSLEEVALGFMERNARGALKRYLCAKLRQTGVSQRAQRTLLGTWLTEIYLDEINGMSVRKRGISPVEYRCGGGGETGVDSGVPSVPDGPQWGPGQCDHLRVVIIAWVY